ncbi:MAG: 23S rRNA (pseudouridine(1915)-N(3))-methyltransferase RlmH [Nitrospirae bacterium]|nr:23S rRNA (pseudouridine(1915)-N(3))-methyltransferase RlmH [Nitrospirota bacterium]
MRKIRLVWVGKTKDSFIGEAIEKYLKLISPYMKVEVVELREAADADPAAARKREAARILEKTSSFVLLDEGGDEMTSPEFSGFIRTLAESSASMDLVIGGAFGTSDEVKGAAARKIALSRMTFTHQMTRIILLEQLYRAFTIIRGKTYHY